jgi:hypothetical protein
MTRGFHERVYGRANDVGPAVPLSCCRCRCSCYTHVPALVVTNLAHLQALNSTPVYGLRALIKMLVPPPPDRAVA